MIQDMINSKTVSLKNVDEILVPDMCHIEIMIHLEIYHCKHLGIYSLFLYENNILYKNNN